MSPSPPVQTKSRKVKKYLRLHQKAKKLAERYHRKITALDPLKDKAHRAEREANAVWFDLNGGQHSAVRQILDLGVWLTNETPLTTEARRRSAK